MEIALAILAFFCLLVGLVGCIVPGVPGLILSYVGLLLLNWSGKGNFSIFFLIIMFFATVAVLVIDNFLPAIMTKKFGGSRAAMVGSVLGLLFGIFVLVPIGILIGPLVGPFLGAMAGELIDSYLLVKLRKKKKPVVTFEITPGVTEVAAEVVSEIDPEDVHAGRILKALKAACGAFLAFILGTGAKIILAMFMIFTALVALFK